MDTKPFADTMSIQHFRNSALHSINLGTLIDHARRYCINGSSSMIMIRGGTTDTQALSCYARIKHLGRNVTVLVWQPRDIETKVVSLIKKPCGKNTIINFNTKI